MKDQMAAVLAGPGRLFCERLKAGISERQCRVNEAQARKLQKAGAWLGHLHHCLDCLQGEEVKRRFPADPLPAGKGQSGATRLRSRQPEASNLRESGAPSLKSKETRMKATEPAEITAPSEFCPKHPEERQIVIMKEGRRKGQLMGACKKCMEERKMKAARLGRAPGRRRLDPREKEALAVVQRCCRKGGESGGRLGIGCPGRDCLPPGRSSQ